MARLAPADTKGPTAKGYAPAVTVTVADKVDDLSNQTLAGRYNTAKWSYHRHSEPAVKFCSQPATTSFKDQIMAFFQVSDNKLALKLFGNKNALLKEKQRQKDVGNWVIHPCSSFR